MISLKPYQTEAIEELKDKVNKLLDFSENKITVFQSPTGSGKTIMIAEMLKRLVKNRADTKRLAFVWISLRKLHKQSKEKLEEYFEDSRIIECSYFNDLEDRMVGENEILFINWESINKKDKNTIVKENEQEFYLTKVIENTKEYGREVILIIDESHHTAKSEKSLDIIINDISPKVTIEVSATPRKHEHLVEVDFKRVVDEGMIKKEVDINPELDKEKAKSSADEFILEAALKKRKELVESYKKEGSNINPLLLIQLPDARTGTIDMKEIVVDLLKKKFNITTENRKLAIYLSDKDDKINLENIEKQDNETEVLIFKQAIAVGWDCPRASILVLFRDWKSITFSIQTVGRIMRMPEFHHYDKEEILNNAYVFTNLADIGIAEGIAKDYFMEFESRRRSSYKAINLNSIYVKRLRDCFKIKCLNS